MEDFLGRVEELQVLERAYASDRHEFFPIYGRRRVGKSQLILHFIRNKPALYYLGKKATPLLQIQEFLQEAARLLQEPLLAQVTPTSWKEALRLVTERATSKKLVLVLDEFQWMVQASPELPSVLQELIDREWRTRKNIFLILCGSYMGFMEREVLGEKSPLFGRRTGQILLRPFSYREAALFHPSWSLAERARTYFLCGGIPFYLRFFSEKRSLEQNIEENFLSEYAPLYREPDFLLREELRELEKYYGVLMSLAGGFRTGQEMARLTGIDERKIHYYLQHLIQLGYVRRQFPLQKKKPSRRLVRYTLDDPLLCFWFRFIYPQLASVMRRKPVEVWRQTILPHLESYFGSRFEVLCREALPVLYQEEKMHAPFEVGEYWDKSVQIDVVGYRQDRVIDLGECKWGSVPSLRQVVKELQDKSRHYPNEEQHTLNHRLFVQKKPPRASLPPGVLCHDLKDLYGGRT